uniref:Uncharacterized protein n=1 Tax=Anopheles culicifacies TaxID=139723 RepID=A0A182M179_9DIPT
MAYMRAIRSGSVIDTLLFVLRPWVREMVAWVNMAALPASVHAVSSFESSSCTLISSSESSLGAGLAESRLDEPVVAAYERDSPAKRAAADVGTSDRNALCSPPINNGVDAVTNDCAACAAATAAAAWAPRAAAAWAACAAGEVDGLGCR